MHHRQRWSLADQPGPRLLKVIGSTPRACAGVYATTVLPGLVRVGAPVVVERRPQD